MTYPQKIILFCCCFLLLYFFVVVVFVVCIFSVWKWIFRPNAFYAMMTEHLASKKKITLLNAYLTLAIKPIATNLKFICVIDDREFLQIYV